MSKVAHYLQEHLLGEILTSSDARRYFSTDASIFSVMPTMIVYPRGENDVRKTARFSWQLAERGRTLPITPRGYGLDRSGAAIGSGIIMAFPRHMNRILEFDGKSGKVIVEPGITLGKLQQTLHTHGRFLAAYSDSHEPSTVGGALAKNSSGDRSVKYGSMINFVKSLKAVLANGEAVEIKRLSKRELNKKLGLATLEGEIYRQLDSLIEENYDTIAKMQRYISKNTAGYNLLDVKRKDGSFDLTPLVVGSEGTLAMITEAELTTELYNPNPTLITAYLDDIKLAEEVMTELRGLPDGPSSAEVYDYKLLELVDKLNPNQLKGVIDKPFPRLVLMIQFDNLSTRVQHRMVKKVQKLFKRNQINYHTMSDEKSKENFVKIGHSVSTVLLQAEAGSRALPFIDDGIVPAERFSEFLEAVYELCDKYRLTTAVWGHLADAHLHMQPFLDLGQVGDRQKLFKAMDDYYRMVIKLGGSTSGEYGDGRIRAPYLVEQYGQEVYVILQKVKQIFDPYNILNPGVKINVSQNDIKPLVRNSYSLDHLYNHLPHS